jgi:hypothetical protein
MNEERECEKIAYKVDHEISYVIHTAWLTTLCSLVL